MLLEDALRITTARESPILDRASDWEGGRSIGCLYNLFFIFLIKFRYTKRRQYYNNPQTTRKTKLIYVFFEQIEQFLN